VRLTQSESSDSKRSKPAPRVRYKGLFKQACSYIFIHHVRFFCYLFLASASGASPHTTKLLSLRAPVASMGKLYRIGK
jgi:hypothetical protein